MPKFLIENLGEKPVQVGIEPWAAVEILAPEESFEIEYDEPAEISFSIMGDGKSGVGIMSERVSILRSGKKKLL